MHWFKKSYFFVFLISIFYVVSSSVGLTADLASERVFAENHKLSEIEVIPGGEIIGIKLYTDGILIIELASFEDGSGNIVCPAKDCGIREGDNIIAVNGNDVQSTDELITAVKNSEGIGINLTIKRSEDSFDVNVLPAKSKEGDYKLGFWVRDSAAGIGTLTFVKKGDGAFFALGHGIADRDLQKNYLVRKGSVENARVLSIVKSKEGVPGEIQATFGNEGQILGEIKGNSNCGIFGAYCHKKTGESVRVASRWEIKEGPATILCSLDGKEPKSYSIEIKKLFLGGGVNEKSMIIQVTDKELIKKTGGIVQGMSGSPIMQNGKLVGAVTHVCVNEPTRGYGIFIENMLAEAEE